ncbi:MAG: DUF559 domain-containing protein [Candidatus Glassbacteria bacterium]
MRTHYNPKLKELARQLRKNSTLAEIVLWEHLKNNQMCGYDFHRQKPIDEFIVDFYCPKLRLIIEIDGVTHNAKLAKDALRQERLEALGFTVLRFLEQEVRMNLEGVLITIKEWNEKTEEKSGHTPVSPLDRGDL